jgi:hypothetical protein
MRYFFIIMCLVLLGVEMKGQSVSEKLTGQVSFVSSQNVYVKFKSTEGIVAGDTLFIPSGGLLIPVLTVNNLSSSSCVCNLLSGTNLSVADLIIAIPKNKKNIIKEPAVVPAIILNPGIEVTATGQDSVKNVGAKQIIKGSISAYSYTDFSNITTNTSQRFRYTFSLDARNISNSKFSFESYISFKHKLGEWDVVKNDVFNALKIYNLAVKYDLNKTTRISLGRKINPRVSSIGAMDGLQVEKTLNKFAFGALVGSRPDYTNYSFDPALFQYGAYVAFNTKSATTYTESSLAFMQQTNNSKTDRRFLYLQHSNQLLKDLSFFSTFEVDLYKVITDSLNNSTPQSTFSPTGLYLSLRYKITKNLTVSGSYDARKNVIYYETFKTSIDSALEKELRQGYRLQANYRITRDIMFGIQGGYRFLKSDPFPSKNINSYLTYSQIPGVKISCSLSASYLESSYMNGKIFGANLTRDFLQGKLSTGIGYRYIDYRLPESLTTIIQNIGEMNVSWQFAKGFSFSVNYEGTFEHLNKYNRIYAQIRKRF